MRTKCGCLYENNPHVDFLKWVSMRNNDIPHRYLIKQYFHFHIQCFSSHCVASSCTISMWGKATKGDDGSPPASPLSPPTRRPRPSPLRPRLGDAGSHPYLWTRPVCLPHTHTHTRTSPYIKPWNCFQLVESKPGPDRNWEETKRFLGVHNYLPSAHCTVLHSSADWPHSAVQLSHVMKPATLCLKATKTLTFSALKRAPCAHRAA